MASGLLVYSSKCLKHIQADCKLYTRSIEPKVNRVAYQYVEIEPRSLLQHAQHTNI